MICPQAARRPQQHGSQCAVKWDRNFKPKLATRSIWKILGPFATASRRTPPVLILHCHSPGVATVDTTTKTRWAEATYSAGGVRVATPGEWQCKIDVHNNDDAWQRGPLWPHRMGPIMHQCTSVTDRRTGIMAWGCFIVASASRGPSAVSELVVLQAACSSWFPPNSVIALKTTDNIDWCLFGRVMIAGLLLPETVYCFLKNYCQMLSFADKACCTNWAVGLARTEVCCKIWLNFSKNN